MGLKSRSCHRGKPRKMANRYDPNNPDYKAVHGSDKPAFVSLLPALFRGRHVAIFRKNPA